MGKSVSDELEVANLTIKTEVVNEDNQEFAETTMNELLGWYGYENNKDAIKTDHSCKSYLDNNSNDMESPKSSGNCGWCDKPIEETTSIASASANFCSELCFSHSRRANFKKNKACDWCKHVRHTLSHVDFQDGLSQLQFCSDKCLNQYKMHIFCRETRAHLELHPHLPVEASTSGNLITPDLWLKNCKTTEIRTPSPKSPCHYDKPPQTSPISLISTTHPLNLKDSLEGHKNKIKSRKKTKKSANTTITCNTFKLLPNDIPQDLRIRQSPIEIPLNSYKYLDNDNVRSNFKPVPSTNDRIPTPQQVNYSDVGNTGQPTMTRFYENLLPPPTIIVPYPIFLPLPIPIPIPLPIPINKNPETKELKEISIQTEPTSSEWNNHYVQNNNESDNKINTVVSQNKKIEPKKKVRMLRKRKRICEPRVALKTRRKIN